jgi:hypothetical protein
VREKLHFAAQYKYDTHTHTLTLIAFIFDGLDEEV